MLGNATRDARRRYNLSQRLVEHNGWYHSFELPGGEIIEGLQSMQYQKGRFARFPIPARLEGQRVLDIGAWDGWFSFEAERRGASVTAVDCVEIPNFLEIHRKLSSRVDYRILDVYDLPAANLGTFGYVFFLGILYHLKHPLLALEIVCGLTTEVAIVESFVIDGDTWREHDDQMPWMEFYETDELGDQLDNWIGPSVSCLMALCRAAGFARVELLVAKGANAAVACHRRWESPPVEPTEAEPELLGVTHSRNYGINFYTNREEYISWWFRAPVEPLSRFDLRAEIDGFGVPAIYLKECEDGTWLANSRLPPGLESGWKQARLRTANSGFSQPRQIAVDIPPASEGLILRDACDGITWARNEVRVADAGFVSCWVKGLAGNCDRNNLVIRLGDIRLAVEYISNSDENGFRQINARVPGSTPKGESRLSIHFGDAGASVAMRVI